MELQKGFWKTFFLEERGIFDGKVGLVGFFLLGEGGKDGFGFGFGLRGWDECGGFKRIVEVGMRNS